MYSFDVILIIAQVETWKNTNFGGKSLFWYTEIVIKDI